MRSSNFYDLAFRSLVVVHSLNLHEIPSDSCLAKSYYGTYGTSSVFLPERDCAVDVVQESRAIPLPEGLEELVWVEQQVIEDDILSTMIPAGSDPWARVDEAWTPLMSRLESNILQAQNSMDREQVIVGQPQISEMGVVNLHRTQTSSLYGLIGYSTQYFGIDEVIMPYHRATVLPRTPFPINPLSDAIVDPVRKVLANLKYEKEVAALVNNISLPQMKATIEWLTGEAKDSQIRSRSSFHPDTLIAADWIQAQIESTGAVCEQRPFLEGYAPNVVCQYEAIEKTNALVLFSAHYDSRGSFGSTRAPGGDDDGSGTTAIINIAHAIGRTGVNFKSNVELVLFAGEEQGLLGSRAYARELKELDANITIMVQADMLAYHKPGEPAQLGLPQYIGSPEVAQLVGNISTLYSPELTLGFTAACCSDHQSFHVLGYPATQVFERAGPIADPMYHNSGDLSDREGYDLEQVRSIAKVQFATLLHVAGYELP